MLLQQHLWGEMPPFNANLLMSSSPTLSGKPNTNPTSHTYAAQTSRIIAGVRTRTTAATQHIQQT
jgi:hypothetical protein